MDSMKTKLIKAAEECANEGQTNAYASEYSITTKVLWHYLKWSFVLGAMYERSKKEKV